MSQDLTCAFDVFEPPVSEETGKWANRVWQIDAHITNKSQTKYRRVKCTRVMISDMPAKIIEQSEPLKLKQGERKLISLKVELPPSWLDNIVVTHYPPWGKLQPKATFEYETDENRILATKEIYEKLPAWVEA
jgi:hypothetical protein